MPKRKKEKHSRAIRKILIESEIATQVLARRPTSLSLKFPHPEAGLLHYSPTRVTKYLAMFPDPLADGSQAGILSTKYQTL